VVPETAMAVIVQVFCCAHHWTKLWQGGGDLLYTSQTGAVTERSDICVEFALGHVHFGRRRNAVRGSVVVALCSPTSGARVRQRVSGTGGETARGTVRMLFLHQPGFTSGGALHTCQISVQLRSFDALSSLVWKPTLIMRHLAETGESGGRTTKIPYKKILIDINTNN